jgi:hypothetical protein
MARKMEAEPETEAVLAAKAELEKVVEDLRAVKERMLAIARRLRAAEPDAPAVATDPRDGFKYTAEDWLAGGLENQAREELGEMIHLFEIWAHEDPRIDIWQQVREDNECAAARQAQA